MKAHLCGTKFCALYVAVRQGGLPCARRDFGSPRERTLSEVFKIYSRRNGHHIRYNWRGTSARTDFCEHFYLVEAICSLHLLGKFCLHRRTSDCATFLLFCLGCAPASSYCSFLFNRVCQAQMPVSLWSSCSKFAFSSSSLGCSANGTFASGQESWCSRVSASPLSSLVTFTGFLLWFWYGLASRLYCEANYSAKCLCP